MLAGAPAVAGATGTTARLALAVAASALLHAFLLAGDGGLAGALRLDTSSLGGSGRGTLHVTLRPAIDAPAASAGGTAPVQRVRPGEKAKTTAPGAGVLPAPRYYRAAELDQRPQIRVHVEPKFPALALSPTGRVVLRLYLDEKGEVEDVAVESADDTGAFAAAARAAFAEARYTPGIKDGKPVRSLVRIEVLFGLPPPPAETAAR